MLCAAPTVLISLANAPAEDRAAARRRASASSPPARHRPRRRSSAWKASSAGSVTQVYGLTETAPFITVCEPRPEHATLSLEERCVIKARQGVELVTSGDLRVLDEAAARCRTTAQTLGEIVVRGNVVMEGLLRRPGGHGRGHAGTAGFTAAMPRWCTPTATSRFAIASRTSSSAEARTFLRSRSKATLMRHPAVQEVGVVGVKHEKWGEAPHAFVVLKPGASATDSELIEFVRERLAHFKAPHARHVREGTPEDRDRQDSEIHSARWQVRDFRTIAG